jgi:hypothetical protein
MAGTDDALREYLDETLHTLDAAYRELLALHNHHYPKCGGGCPAHSVLASLAHQIIRTLEVQEAVGYSTSKAEEVRRAGHL